MVAAGHPQPPAVLRAADFDYALPPELVAQSPAPVRDASRLLVLRRPDGRIDHRRFSDLPSLVRPGDLVVLNQSKVLPARLRGRKPGTEGSVEILLVEELARNEWRVLLRPGKRVRTGTVIHLLDRQGQPTAIAARVLDKSEEGHCQIRFDGLLDLGSALDALGETPLPPYIQRAPADPASAHDAERYQTVFARDPGSVAAPTAGLHFTAGVLERLQSAGAGVAFVTLHVGLGTFAPVKTEALADHRMHEERFELTPAAAEAIQAARARGGRIWAIGTTTVRVLETVAARHGGDIVPTIGRTRLFLHPPASFQVVDALLTNFHLPRSTLLMLVSAFASPGDTRGCGLVKSAYAAAIRERYRFFSYGDAMLILTTPGAALPRPAA